MKPYIIFMQKDAPQTMFALDRQYNHIKGHWDPIINFKDIVQLEVFQGYPYLSKPVHGFINSNDTFIALWTNYYD